MRAPKMRHKLPNVPSQQQVRAVLDSSFHNGQQPKTVSPFPERDLAIWELAYCGLRNQELVNINVEDFRDHCRVLLVHGKGNKERLVPLSDGGVCCWITGTVRRWEQPEGARECGDFCGECSLIAII